MRGCVARLAEARLDNVLPKLVGASGSTSKVVSSVRSTFFGVGVGDLFLGDVCFFVLLFAGLDRLDAILASCLCCRCLEAMVMVRVLLALEVRAWLIS